MPGPGRISVTDRGAFENSSDPAAGSESSGSNFGNDAPVSPGNPARSNSDPIGPGNDASQMRGNVVNERSNNNNSASATNSDPDEAARIAELRAILPDSSIEELRMILRENDRASANTRQSANDAAMAQMAAVGNQSSTPAPTESTPSRPSLPSTGSRRSRRTWQPCTPAPSRPGIFREGGPIETGGTYNIGVTNEFDLDMRRIDAGCQVQEALNEKLGYNLRESGQYEEMERLYQEGERMLASTAAREKKVLPAMMMWEAPPVSRMSMSMKEPSKPEPGEPLPLPLSFGGHDEGMHNGGNGEICVGKYVDPGPNCDEDEEKREELSIDNESWTGVSIDTSPMGPYEHVVRCWKCRAGLKVHIEVGLVACPRCRTISPATEMANV